jgi:hypothetical protein
MKKILLIISLFVSFEAIAQTDAESIYLLAWKKYNAENYIEAGELFEKSIKAGKTWSGVYLNAASSWAMTGNKEKAFENLFKMVDAGYINKQYILDEFPEFNKYYETGEWKRLMKEMDQKITAFSEYTKNAGFQKLSKEQMYNDFDSLVHNIVLYSPHLKVRQRVCGTDYEQKFSNMRKEIGNCESSKQFAILLYRVLLVCQDGHTSISRTNPLKLLSDGMSADDCAAIVNYQKLYNSLVVTDINLPQLVYYKGKYFTRSEYHHNNFSLPAKAELVSVNGITPAKYLLRNIDKKGFLSWDFDYNHFYSESLLQNSIASDTTLRLTFMANKKKRLLELNLTTGLKPKQAMSDNDGFVEYWDNFKTLYIRIPKMVNEDFYPKEIAGYKNKDIEKIIIDIRGNPGGSDNVWSKTLAAIISEKINLKVKYSFNSALKQGDTTYVPTENFRDLDLVYKWGNWGYRGIGGSKSSINYNGKIYVLYDDMSFSAAGSLVSVCYYSDNLVAVGVPTGRILGFGTNPYEFRLPNTKIGYRIEPILDITNCTTYKDIFHDKPELDVNLSLDEKILLKTNPYTSEFLRNEDPYIKRILYE